MRFNKLDLNLLVALDALLAEKNITRAARRINLSQSATSGVLARLRDYFGDELLIQVGRTMVATPMARGLEGAVRDVLLRIQSTIAVQPQFDPATSTRHFRIMASDYPISVLIAEASRRAYRVAPGITLEIVVPGDEVEESVDRGEIDILIMPTQYTSAHHPRTPLYEETYSCVVWNENALVGNTLSLDQYMALGHVTTQFGHRRHPSLEQWFLQTSALSRRIEVTTNNFNTLPLLVIGTDRVATMHTRLANMFAAYLPLRILPLPVEFPSMVWCMQWPSHLGSDQAHLWLRSLLQASA